METKCIPISDAELKIDNRYKWVDVSKAIAMIFVYIGHWKSPHAEVFAYAFHIQLFFLVGGFFATRTAKRKIKEWLSGHFYSLVLPYFLWVIISFFFNNIDNEKLTGVDYLKILTEPNSMQPNYWFFPAFFAVALSYYILFNILHKPIVITIIAFLLHILWGAKPVFNASFTNAQLWPIALQIINNWIGISSIFTYLFWYSLGATLFDKVFKYIKLRDRNFSMYYILGFVTGLLSFVIFFDNDLIGFPILNNLIFFNNCTLSCYRIIRCLIIICFVFFISKLMEDSKMLNNIGRSSMNFMGLEFITHNYFVLSFLPMINLGVPTINSTIHIVTITVIQIVINIGISNCINKYFPVLNGDYAKLNLRK